ncbi:hypothetical protein HY389_00890 [Candidatus Daviesbacteria bacterium]|nr:hypothetical protein [Candidatus Daviesbacteria bacterium]
MKLKLIAIGLMVVLGLIIWWINQPQDSQLKSILLESGNTKTSPTPAPSLTPLIMIDQNTNLSDEAQKLTPEDFSNDFTRLKNQAGSF